MPLLYLDVETRSTTDIKLGLDRYFQTAKIILWQWAVGDSDVVIEEGPQPSADLNYYLQDPTIRIVAHNAAFERAALRACCTMRISPDRFICTMAQAMSHSLPGGLEALGDIFGLSEDQAKIKEGRKLIRMFCVPKKDGTFVRPQDKPAEWEQFRQYAIRDVVTTRILHKKMPRWNYPDNEFERRLYLIDQQINDRGFGVDLRLAEAAVEAVAEAKGNADSKIQGMTDGAVGSVTQRDRLLAHLLDAQGVKLPDLRADTLERRLGDETLPEPVRQLIAMRLEIAQTSTSKYVKLLNCHVGGRLRGTLQYCGARRTKRWAGRLFQPQNLARPSMKWPAIQDAIEALKGGYATAIYDDITSIASNCIRSVIAARRGRQISAADLANIEGRSLAWGAREAWKIDAFIAYDAGVGPDLYIASYAKAFGLHEDDVTKDQRQVGKVLELSMGYQGGVGAFASMAAVYGLDVNELAADALPALPAHILREAENFYDWAFQRKRTYGMKRDTFIGLDGLKRAWREAHPATVEFWADVERAAKRVIGGAAEAEAGPVRFTMHKSWLLMHMPSGGVLCYPGARIEDDGGITYLGVNQYTHQWGRIRTYAGKLVENWTQGFARDVLAHGLVRAVDDGYEPVLTVHDEIVTEEEIASGRNAAGLGAHMATVPVWAPGLPLATAGFDSPCYKKE